MSTIKSSAEHLTLNADGASKDIKFQANGVEKASISSSGAFTSTTIDATKLTGTIPNFTSTGIDDNATETAITIDAAENVGIGVVPEAWHNDYRNLAVGGTGALWSQKAVGTGKAMGVGQNVYYDGSNKYITTDEASRYYQANGVHTFEVAASGTADAAITWTTALNITNDGRGLSQFTAKAWVDFNATGTVAIRDSHNVSSITDHDVGNQSINFSNNMANANYAGFVSSNNAGNEFMGKYVATVATSYMKVYPARSTSGGMADATYVHALAFGD